MNLVKVIRALFTPIIWAIGFLIPLFAQAMLALDLTDSAATAYIIAALVAVPWGVMAQLRGSWIWVR